MIRRVVGIVSIGKTHTVINGQTDYKKFLCWIFSEVGALIYSFFTEVRLRILKVAVTPNSFLTQSNSSGVS